MRNTGATGPLPSHQTVKLTRGRHSAPEEGVCVMELASMLSHEPFSDRPQSVCPVIGAFLRAYNDRLDDRWRQDLYAYAAKVVGTRSTIAVEHRRAQMCREWARRTRRHDTPPEELPEPSNRPGRLRGWLQSYCHRPEHAGHHAAIALGQPEVEHGGVLKLDHERHRATLRLLDQLIALGRHDEPRLADLHAMAVEYPPVQRL